MQWRFPSISSLSVSAETVFSAASVSAEVSADAAASVSAAVSVSEDGSVSAEVSVVSITVSDGVITVV